MREPPIGFPSFFSRAAENGLRETIWYKVKLHTSFIPVHKKTANTLFMQTVVKIVDLLCKYCESFPIENKRPTGLNGHLSIGDFTLTSCQKGSYLYINSPIIE